jgi:Tfp pilus assembly pilus retraction ATPase PilT
MTTTQEPLDIAIKAVEIYASTHPRPPHVTQRQAAQMLSVSEPTVRKLIEENRLDKLHAAVETGKEDGMQTFNQSLYQLVKAKMITEENALLRATNPDALKMNLRGIFLDESRRILASA